MARKLNTLLRLTETAWPNANRRSLEKDPSEPTTAIGNRTKEAAFTTMVSRAVSAEFSAAGKHASGEQTQQLQRGALRENHPPLCEGLLPRIHDGDTTTSTISFATCATSVSSTSCKKMRSSEDWPIRWRTSSVEP